MDKLFASAGLLMLSLLVILVFGMLFWAFAGTTATLVTVAAAAFFLYWATGRRRRS